MALRLLGRSSSINVRKVLWTLDELHLPFEHEDDWASPQRPSRAPEFLALNPNGLVPVLQDGGEVLWESNTICRYLAASRGRADLLPTDPRGRAAVEMWMDWQATELNTAWRYAFLSRVRRAPGFEDEARAARSFASWTERMAILEAQLARTGGYVAGPDFTLADIALGLSAHRYRTTPGEHGVFPRLDAWTARLAQRPGFQLYATPALP